MDALAQAQPEQRAKGAACYRRGAGRVPRAGAGGAGRARGSGVAAPREQGDPSYYVEAEAAVSLGKTRVADAYDVLLAKVETPSWNETIRGGVFAGLGELGDARVVDVLASWATDRDKADGRARGGWHVAWSCWRARSGSILARHGRRR